MSAEGVTQCFPYWSRRAVYLSGKRTGLTCRCSTLWRADSISALIFVQSLAFAKLVVPGRSAGRNYCRQKDLIDKFNKNPLARALRCDKLCLAALEATLRLYLDPEKAREHIPTPHMISREPAELARAAHSLGARIKNALTSAGLACEIKYCKDIYAPIHHVKFIATVGSDGGNP